jgi:hypothetical protein
LYGGTPNKSLFQFDMEAENLEDSLVKIADVDTSLADYGRFITVMYSKLAPDGKIYFTTGMGSIYMHRIHFPDQKGLACGFGQRDFLPPCRESGIPHFPNYALGAEKCCGYRIDRGLSLRPDTTLEAKDTGSYQWLYCDSNWKPILGAKSKKYKPLKTGKYAVRIANIYCKDTSECRYVYIKDSATTSISNLSNINIRLYPNPSTHYSTLLFSHLPTSKVQILVTDGLGRRMVIDEVSLLQPSYTIDTRRFSNGIYYVNVYLAKKEIFKSKLEVVK